MIHGIYLKSRPKNKWHLVSVAVSPEADIYEVDAVKKQAEADGNEAAQVAVQLFESSFWIPEYVDEIKEHTPQFN
jgi:hypothetical protein